MFVSYVMQMIVQVPRLWLVCAPACVLLVAENYLEKRQEKLFDQIMSGGPPLPPPVYPPPVSTLQSSSSSSSSASPPLSHLQTAGAVGSMPVSSPVSVNAGPGILLPPRMPNIHSRLAPRTPLGAAWVTSTFLSFLSMLLPPHVLYTKPDNALPLPSKTRPPTPFPLPGSPDGLCTTQGIFAAKKAEGKAEVKDAAKAATAADTFCLSLIRGCPVISRSTAFMLDPEEQDEKAVKAVAKAALKDKEASGGEKCHFKCVESSPRAVQAAALGSGLSGEQILLPDSTGAQQTAASVAGMKKEDFEKRVFDYLPRDGVLCGFFCGPSW